jgi:transcriptional regulator with XRE-family HTH domain
MDNFIGTRLKEFREKTNIKMPEIARETRISKENLYKWEKGVKPSDIDEYNRLKNYLDKKEGVNEYVLNEPVAEYKTSKSLLICIFLTQDEENQRYTEENALPGSVIEIKGHPALIAYRNDPVIGEADGLVTVTGESMEPRFKSGSLIAIKKVKYTNIINAGYDYYIIDRNGKGLLRKVKASDETNGLALASENETDYPTITRKWDDILAIFSIEAVVTKQSS